MSLLSQEGAQLPLSILMPLKYGWTAGDQLLFKECFQCKKEKSKEFKMKTKKE